MQTFQQRLKALSARVVQDGLILTEDQVRALEKASQEKEAHGEIENEHPGYLGSQVTYYVDDLKGRVGGSTSRPPSSPTAGWRLRSCAIASMRSLPPTCSTIGCCRSSRSTKARSPQTNGICERFHQTVQNEFYVSAFRCKLYHSLEELQRDVDSWVESYNAGRTHTGRYCYEKTPLRTFIASAKLAYDRELARIQPTTEVANPVM